MCVGIEDSVQSVAGFASLHCAITLLVALMVAVHAAGPLGLHWVFWTNFGVTVVATLYFGWHYVADDIAGIAIALSRLLHRRHRQRAEVRPARALHATPRRRPPRCPSTTRSGLNYNLVVRQADTPVKLRKL